MFGIGMSCLYRKSEITDIDCVYQYYRAGNVTRGRGRANKRFAPYRSQDRGSMRENVQTMYQGHQAQSHWDRSRSEPPPPGESRPPPRFGPPDMSKIRCYACLKFGHKSPQCPEKRA